MPPFIASVWAWIASLYTDHPVWALLILAFLIIMCIVSPWTTVAIIAIVLIGGSLLVE